MPSSSDPTTSSSSDPTASSSSDPTASSSSDPTASSSSDPTGPVRRTNRGAGRVLVAVYGLFAIAATSRAAVQLIAQFHEAPLAYLLSLFSGVVYIVATITLGMGRPLARRIAIGAVVVELVGVLAVGTASVVDPAAFPRATVWSVYGIGYGFVPVILPLFGLWWLYATRPRPATEEAATESADGEPTPR